MLGIFKLKGEVVSDFVDLVCWFWVLFEWVVVIRLRECVVLCGYVVLVGGCFWGGGVRNFEFFFDLWIEKFCVLVLRCGRWVIFGYVVCVGIIVVVRKYVFEVKLDWVFMGLML